MLMRYAVEVWIYPLQSTYVWGFEPGYIPKGKKKLLPKWVLIFNRYPSLMDNFLNGVEIEGGGMFGTHDRLYTVCFVVRVKYFNAFLIAIHNYTVR